MEHTGTMAKPRVRRISRTVFQIASRTRPGLTHTADTLTLRCSCEAGQNGKRCWHLVWALQAEQWYTRAEAEHKARTATPRPLTTAA